LYFVVKIAMLEPWRKGVVIKIENETSTTRRYWIEIPEVEKFDFLPGQFVTLDLPIHEKKNKRWRSYSIASSPDATNVIELVIVRLEGGAGTAYLFDEVSEGSELLLRGPQGVFVLPSTLDKDLFFICTGTGVAPFRSMLHHINRFNIPHKKIYLIFGCRYVKDCLYGQELKALELDIPDYYYMPTFSREPEENNFVRRGYVHKVYEEILSSEKPAAKFYLCGWKDMIDEAKQKIIGLGYDKKDIHLELYG
jgi:ferredoxin-NADP reductase